MLKSFLKIWTLTSILYMLVITVSINADTDNNSETTIAVLSFVNYSSNSQATKAVMKELYTQLDSHHMTYLPQTELRKTLRRHRIRTVGSINQQDVKHIKESAHINRIIIGAINIYENKMNPELSISIRIIDADNMTIIAAVTQSANGKDFEKFFGLGKINSIELLTQNVLNLLITKLVENINLFESNTARENSEFTIALIPFDNISENKKAGHITTNILLTSLVQKGYKIIEPGIVNYIMLKNKRLLRGEIDYITLNQIKSEFEIDLLITGSIDTFTLPLGTRQPEIELGLRTLDASNGRIIIMYNDNIKGNDSESFFGFGKINAMGNLIKKSFSKYIQSLEKKSETYFAKRN